MKELRGAMLSQNYRHSQIGGPGVLGSLNRNATNDKKVLPLYRQAQQICNVSNSGCLEMCGMIVVFRAALSNDCFTS